MMKTKQAITKQGKKSGHPAPDNAFIQLCRILSAIMQVPSEQEKILLFARYLRTLTSEADLDRAVRYTGEGVFSNVSERRIAIGHRTLALAAANFCGIDYEKVYKPCRAATGNTPETIEKLTANLPASISRRKPANLTLGELEMYFEELATAKRRHEKEALLIRIWEQMTPPEIRFAVRLLLQKPRENRPETDNLQSGGNMMQTGTILQAVAKAFYIKPERVRRAHMLTGSAGETAVLALQQKLHTATFRMFRPVPFMRTEEGKPSNPSHHVGEEKLDGIRVQVHLSPDCVRLFSHELQDITSFFPEIADRLGKAVSQRSSDGPSSGNFSTKTLVLEGVLCAFENDTIRSSSSIRQRMTGIKSTTGNTLVEKTATRHSTSGISPTGQSGHTKSATGQNNHPSVIFIAYDLLIHNGEPTLDLPVHQRRRQLEQICHTHNLPVTRQYKINSQEDISKQFNRALDNGSSGLILKHRDSTYEYGQGTGSWLKLKRPPDTLHTVVMYAHAGNGRRGGICSGFTLGIRVDEDDRYEEQFIPIGKVDSGCTDEQLSYLNQQVRKLVVERFGPTFSLKPGIVVETMYDDIRVNRRTKAGFILHQPRLKHLRMDLTPDHADTLEEVERRHRMHNLR